MNKNKTAFRIIIYIMLFAMLLSTLMMSLSFVFQNK